MEEAYVEQPQDFKIFHFLNHVFKLKTLRMKYVWEHIIEDPLKKFRMKYVKEANTPT